MITELFIEGNRVDISADISSLITFAIDDIKNFGTRQTAFSKTVVLPGTSNNNKLFGSIFETGINNSYDSALPNILSNFNASKAARCYLFQDNLQAFKGTMRMLEVINDKGRIEYEVALNGELTSLSVSLSSSFLSDLDFSAYDQFWTVANIVSSWDNTPGSGVMFPLIDYGGYSLLKHDWDFKSFRPALYAKEYIDKIFAKAGFRYVCDLFNTERFKRIVIPHNQKVLTNITDVIFKATNASSQHVVDNSISGAMYFPIMFTTIVAGAFTNVGGTSFTYTGTPTLTLTMQSNFSGYYNFHLPPIGGPLVARFKIQKNGVDYYVSTRLLDINTGTDILFAISDITTITIATGDVITFNFYLTGSTSGLGNIYLDFAEVFLRSTTPITNPVDYNEQITIKYAIPQNIRQIDFFVSIIQLFNLYVYEDRFDEKLIRITPYVDFYSTDSGNAVDWTYKMNRAMVSRIKPMSELTSKTYKFNYKDDTDYWNDLYKKRYNQGYGSYSFDSNFEFASAENKLELIFAPTPLVGYISEDKVYSTIFKRTGTLEESTDSAIRILQTKKVTGVSSWVIKNVTTTLGTYTSYGYAGHLNDPDNPTNDLNFGALNELFFVLATGDLSVTQFNVYWSSYMAEITDKDSKLLTARFYLTPKDINELDFSKYVHVDGVIYRLMSIVDYNASQPNDCECNLLKVLNTIY